MFGAPIDTGRADLDEDLILGDGGPRGAGFSVAMTAHAYALLDSYLYGFAMQEANLPATGGQDMSHLAEVITARFADGDYPHLLELTTQHVLQPGYDFGHEFEFGLTLLLDGLERYADG